MRYTPTAEELELAVHEVLRQSDKNLTAKEVREKLLHVNGGWKIPAERRIAKFVKRQNSRKSLKETGEDRNGRIGRFFKGDNNNNNNGSKQKKKKGDDKPEGHPNDESSLSTVEKEKKNGLRSSFVRMFSSRKTSLPGSNEATLADQKVQEKKDTEVASPTSVVASPPAVTFSNEVTEHAEPTTSSEHNKPTATINTVPQEPESTSPPPAGEQRRQIFVHATREEVYQPTDIDAEEPPPVADVIVADGKKLDSDKMDAMSREVLVTGAYAYWDDNDGKKKNDECDCPRICVIQ